MNQIVLLCFALVAFPFLSFAILSFGKEKQTFWPWIAIFFQTIAFIISILIFTNGFGEEPIFFALDWINLAAGVNFDIGIAIDDHAVLMLLVVQLVSLLVHFYAVVYFEHDRARNRFFSFLGLFIFAMNGLVLADNLLMLFVFWELVGFSSYLLIGFWYDKPAAAAASKKAFVVNRIADLGLVVAILIFWSEYDTLNIHQLKHVVFHFHESFIWLHVAGFGLFLGCMGKSAQFPFQIWLPDAMEGPTPVSALIHAATMVAAGIYLLVKMVFLLTPDVMQTIALVGSVTAFLGAFFALTQFDLKRVLAFSTISQLGFMMAGIGTGGAEAAFFHLTTHAFFKACLFLSAGSVIHAMQHALEKLQSKSPNETFDPQDMRNMGGLMKVMPFTFIGFTLSGFALAGIPFFSGFLSKDAILVSVYNNANGIFDWVVFALLVVTPCFTTYYIFKLLFTVFGGKLKVENQLKESNSSIHESKWLMVVPIIIFSLLSLAFVFSKNPFDFENGWLMSEIVLNKQSYSQNHLLLGFVSIAAILFGITALIIRNSNSDYKLSNTWLYKLSLNQLYMNEILHRAFVNPTILISDKIAIFDLHFVDRAVNLLAVSQVVIANIIAWIDRTIVDGIVNSFGFIANWFGKLFSKFQNGQIQNYIFYTLLVVVFVLVYLLVFNR